ncbi:DCN1-like protein 4 [Geranomyces variabilis]|nr:DCN1-like protein 4 [Geranomyces variabilis]
MPPKKRTATTATTKAKKPKASHTASATTTADMTPKTGSRPRSAKNAPVAADSNGFNAKKCAAWFQSYEDPDEEGMVGPEGMEKLCSDLGIELASIEILIIAWRLGAQNMGYFKKSEWLDGMKKLEVDSTDSLAQLLPSLARIYDSPSEFKELYMFAFAFAKEEDQKSLSIEHAQGMWQILCPPDRFEHIEPFLRFIAEKHPVKVVNKDQWRSFIEFSNVVDGDLAGYDESSAWPVLFDDYVAWRRAQKKE